MPKKMIKWNSIRLGLPADLVVDLRLMARALNRTVQELAEKKLIELVEENRAAIEKMRALDREINS